MKVESLETGRRAQVRGDEWVNRRTAGRDMLELSDEKEVEGTPESRGGGGGGRG